MKFFNTINSMLCTVLLTIVLALVSVQFEVPKQLAYMPLNATANMMASSMQLHESVVIVQGAAGHGSGFFISEDQVMTNHHVVAKLNAFKRISEFVHDDIEIQMYDGRRVKGKVQYDNKDMDISVIKLEEKVGKPLKFAKENLENGAPLFMMGNGSIEWYSVTAGRADRIYRFDGPLWRNNQQLMRIYAIGGYSGSAVLDMYTGEVVGVLAGGSTQGIDLGIMIPVEDLHRFMQEKKPPVQEAPEIKKSKDVWKDIEANHKMFISRENSSLSFTATSNQLSNSNEESIRAYCKRNFITLRENTDENYVFFSGGFSRVSHLQHYIFADQPLTLKVDTNRKVIYSALYVYKEVFDLVDHIPVKEFCEKHGIIVTVFKTTAKVRFEGPTPLLLKIRDHLFKDAPLN